MVYQQQPSGSNAVRVRLLGVLALSTLTVLVAVSFATKRFNATGAFARSKHSVVLTWKPSPSPTSSGYNVYRSTERNGYYTRLNATPVKGVNYLDSPVLSGQTYYYAVTAVDSRGNESEFSKGIQMVIP